MIIIDASEGDKLLSMEKLKCILNAREMWHTSTMCLLVDPPGIGKSTLAWELCHKWEELESVKHYELVVLIS